jgi:hypothetical protein
MIKPGKHNAILVLLSMMLFLTFSMMHQFDFLLPASPLSATSLSTMPTFEIVEETASEDEVEHNDSYVIMPFLNDKFTRTDLPTTGLFIANILTPPPDMA